MKYFILLLFLAMAVPMQAQNNNGNAKDKTYKENSKQDKKAKKKKKDKADKADKNKKKANNDDDAYFETDNSNERTNKVKSNNGKGNAYGKDKYGLEGREFGQERARQAKLKNKERNQELQETVLITQNRLPTLQERIERARQILITQKPTLSTQEYEAKTIQLQEAVNKMTTLEKLVLVAQSFQQN